MADEMSSSERMLAALNCEKPDHIPMAFMIFGALNQRLNNPQRGGDLTSVIEAQIDLGLDTVVDLTHFAPQVDDHSRGSSHGIRKQTSTTPSAMQLQHWAPMVLSFHQSITFAIRPMRHGRMYSR
jgi:hypothetical protein